MKNIFQYGLIITIFMSLALTTSAQKFGYTNSQAILLEMPDVKRADAKLEALQKQLQKKGQQMLEEYQKKGADLDRRYKAGELSQIQAEAEMTKLREEEQRIMKYEQDMMAQLATKREELIKPILDNVQKAIDDVAAEQGYQYVFDTSTGVLLYAKPEDDITGKVKTKLGVSASTPTGQK